METIASLEEKCCGCLLCAEICSKNAIEVRTDNRGFITPIVDIKKCIKCGLCVRRCPIINSDVLKQPVYKVYAAISRDEETLQNSASGGVFFELAKSIIDKGGSVYGAAFNDDMSVSHKRGITYDDIRKFQGSKYVQSRMDSVYEQLGSDLLKGKLVLFSGTPCQIGAIREYCSLKNYNVENLIMIDIQCFGVPSPGLWKKHITFAEKCYGRIKDYRFRSKKEGWSSSYKANIQLFNGDEVYNTRLTKAYNELYSSHFNIRESCYSCPFTDSCRVGDITLGDCWQIWDMNSEFYNSNGTSQMLITNRMGGDKNTILLEVMRASLDVYELNYEEVVQKDMNLNRSVIKPDTYDNFWRYTENHSYEEVINKYTSYSIRSRVMRKIGNVMHRFRMDTN